MGQSSAQLTSGGLNMRQKNGKPGRLAGWFALIAGSTLLLVSTLSFFAHGDSATPANFMLSIAAIIVGWILLQRKDGPTNT